VCTVATMRRRGAVGFESTTYVLQRLSLTLNVRTVNMMQVECFILSFLRSYRISPTYQGTLRGMFLKFPLRRR
jgi:hypothetical protein